MKRQTICDSPLTWIHSGESLHTSGESGVEYDEQQDLRRTLGLSLLSITSRLRKNECQQRTYSDSRESDELAEHAPSRSYWLVFQIFGTSEHRLVVPPLGTSRPRRGTDDEPDCLFLRDVDD